MSEQLDILERTRAARVASDCMAGHDEARRQALGRAAFDDIFELGGRLASLVACERCGLLDDASPCSECQP